ncbi:MAG: dihydroxyacetone kinase subunit L [Anaerolineae bacterium]|nr:dihydroxyacetone kinase subunit L [Anaerolineae bacterium]
MTDSSIAVTERIVRTMADVSLENEHYFAELDGVCGDGDFGISLANGFRKLMDEWDSLDRSSPGTFLKKVSMIITSRVGGVSGAIWGTAFMRAGMTAGDKADLTWEDVVAMLRSAEEGMKKRGQSGLGDKTLLDGFIPALDEFESVKKNGGTTQEALNAAAAKARAQTEVIKPWIAKRGRASYTGERSCDTYDAGSIAVAMMAERIAETWQ